MILFPPAKINLGLRITEKRTDGFHDIETIFTTIGLTDILEYVILPSPVYSDKITVTGLDPGGDPAQNLVLKALNAIRTIIPVPYLGIHLHKIIPAGAGLGGGSSDAACLLKSLNKYFKAGLGEPELRNIALSLGSDCPFFIDGNPVFATGRGEIMNHVEISIQGYYLVLLNPGLGVSTKEAYQSCKPAKPENSLFNLVSLPLEDWKGNILNDFEDFAFEKHPVIKELKEGLYNTGAIFSLMSGSGSSVYGIFRDKPVLPESIRRFLIYEGVI